VVSGFLALALRAKIPFSHSLLRVR